MKNPIFLTALRLLVSAVTIAVAVSTALCSENFGNNVQARDPLFNSRLQFERTKFGHVAFMGGSITEMEGYRPMVYEILRKRFPDTNFLFVNAGISSTCSTTGAFRLERDVSTTGAFRPERGVQTPGPVDLLFVEFAVNDDQDAAHTREECIRGMEGIVRHLRQQNPNADIVITHFVNEGMLKSLGVGQTPLTIEAHEAVAKHYGIPSINLAKEVSSEIASGKLTWAKYGGVHPAPFGNAICAAMIDELFSRVWAQPLASTANLVKHDLPAPLDPLSYSAGRFLDLKSARLGQGWEIRVASRKVVPVPRARFGSIPMLQAEKPGSEMSIDFEGTALGAYVLAGPDAGILDVQIDDTPWRQVDLYHRFSANLQYPRTVLLGSELAPCKHTATVRLSSETHSSGTAARIMEIGAN